jgi:hypothetical protein
MGKIMLRLNVLWLLIFFSCGSEIATAKVHYIRSDADGRNNGNDWKNAWTKIPSKFSRGHTYYIADGAYKGFKFKTPESSETFIYFKKATKEDHGTNTGWSDDFGDGSADFTGTIFLHAGFVEFDGQRGNFKGREESYGFQIHAEGTPGFAVGDINSSHWVFKHIRIWKEDKDINVGGSRAFDFTPGRKYISNIHIDHCYIQNMTLPFYIMNTDSVLIEHSVAEDNHSDPQHHSELASIRSSSNITFRWNWFEDMEGTGGINSMSGECFNWYIYGNVFYGSGDPTCQGFSHGAIGDNARMSFSKDIHIYNNSFINLTGRGGIRFLNNDPTNIVVRNNIWNNCAVTNAGATDWSHNYYTGMSKGTNMQYSGALCGRCRCPNCPQDVNPQIMLGYDPFKDQKSLNFELEKATKPGFVLPSPFNIDKNGNVRGEDGSWDRGAFEFVKIEVKK